MPGYKSQRNLEKSFLSEAELWEDFRNGCETAYTYIYQQYAYLLYSYGNKISSDAALVEDCMQDLFVKLWINKSKLGAAPSIKNYLLKAFRRLLKDAIQKNNSKQETSDQDLDFKLTLSSEAEDSRQELQVEKEKKLQVAIAQLSSRQKEVIYLRFYKKMPNEEIADVMAISVPSVYNLVSKALTILERHIHFLSLLLLLFSLLPATDLRKAGGGKEKSSCSSAVWQGREALFHRGQ